MRNLPPTNMEMALFDAISTSFNKSVSKLIICFTLSMISEMIKSTGGKEEPKQRRMTVTVEKMQKLIRKKEDGQNETGTQKTDRRKPGKGVISNEIIQRISSIAETKTSSNTLPVNAIKSNKAFIKDLAKYAENEDTGVSLSHFDSESLCFYTVNKLLFIVSSLLDLKYPQKIFY